MALTKKYRRTRNSLALGLALVFLWWLDLGGPSQKDGKRDREQATTQSDATRGGDGNRQAKPENSLQAHVEPDRKDEELTQSSEQGPVQEPPEDLIEGRRASFERLLLDEDYVRARLWLELASGARSESLRKLYEECRVKLARLGDQREQLLRDRLSTLTPEQAELEVVRFGRDFPERKAGLLIEAPVVARSAPSTEELARWSLKMNDALPIEIQGVGRLLRFSKGKAILRVPGEVGDFRHARWELVKLPPATLLACAPPLEKEAARRFLCGLFAAAGLPVSASWLYYGKIRLSDYAPDPGR